MLFLHVFSLRHKVGHGRNSSAMHQSGQERCTWKGDVHFDNELLV